MATDAFQTLNGRGQASSSGEVTTYKRASVMHMQAGSYRPVEGSSMCHGGCVRIVLTTIHITSSDVHRAGYMDEHATCTRGNAANCHPPRPRGPVIQLCVCILQT